MVANLLFLPNLTTFFFFWNGLGAVGRVFQVNSLTVASEPTISNLRWETVMETIFMRMKMP